MIKLVPINGGNLGYYCLFEQNYSKCLEPYMSRIYPHRYEEQERLTEQKQLFWNYILFHDKRVGSVWIEKESKHDLIATLGIFIYEESDRGKGIGEKAIIRAIGQGSKILGVETIELRVRANNQRAIDCYHRCGFQDICCFRKQNGIKVIQMERRV